MKLPRLSLRAVMAIVVIAAIDCLTLRETPYPPGFVARVLLLMVQGSLPMANVLALGVALLTGSRGRWRAFWLGFGILGMIVLLLSISSMILGIDTIVPRREFIPPLLTRLLDNVGVPRRSISENIQTCLILPSILLIPQVISATIGGLVFTVFWRKPLTSESPDTPVQTRKSGWLVLAVLVVVIPEVTNRILRYHEIDPQIGRLAAGSTARVFTLPTHLAFGVDAAPPSDHDLQQGQLVKVEGDEAPAYPVGFWWDWTSPRFWGDGRKVEVTILEGPEAGQSIKLDRMFLRP